MNYEDWYNENEEKLIDEFLMDNKEFDRMCRETYEEEN